MQLGIRHSAVGAKGLKKAFQHAAKIGAEGLEIVYAKTSEAAALGRDEHAQELIGLAKDSGLGLSSLALTCLNNTASLIGKPQAATRAQKLVGRALTAAARVGAAVVVVPFLGKNTIEAESELQDAGAAMLDLVDPAEEAGVVLGIQTTLNSHQQQFLLDYLGNTPNVKICFNTGTALARKFDVATVLRDLGPDGVAQVYCQDVRLRGGHPPDYSVSLGQGNVDFRAVAEALRALAFDGWVVVGAPPDDTPPADVKADLLFARDLLGA